MIKLLKTESLWLELCIVELRELIDTLAKDSEDGKLSETTISETIKLAAVIEDISAQIELKTSILREACSSGVYLDDHYVWQEYITEVQRKGDGLLYAQTH